MGVAGLWDVLKPAATIRSLTHLAVKDGFEANPNGKRGFRLGIDASIWFFHAEYGREGENPVLRTLFFRCASLMHTTFLPLFVFDGPKRPDVKRGKQISKSGHKLIPGMKQIVEAFGFEWRMAPGEAEAELAYLNRIGVIDGILSDDVDNFLFGAETVLRNNTLSSNRANPILNSAGKDDKNHSRIFRLADIQSHPSIQLTRGGMILIGLMSGGDYEQGGLAGFGVTTAHALARCGFGDTLYEAAVNLDRETLETFLVSWRDDLRDELRTNSKGKIGRKQMALAKSLTDRFPDVDILLSYVKPITSESMGRESSNSKITWEREPDLGKLAGICELFFEWGYKEAIIKRFRTVMWHSIVLRILRRAVLDQELHPSESWVPNTPSRKNAMACGTPSKMITKHFSTLCLSSPAKPPRVEDEDDSDGERLIIKVHSYRSHPSTDGLPEYRLEIAPKQLVRLAESGIRGLRAPEPDDEWASDDPEDDESEGRKRGKKGPIDPDSHLRVWMPASMVKLVEQQLVDDYEDQQKQKRLKKVKKAARATAPKEKTCRKKAPVSDAENEDIFSSPPMKDARKTPTEHRSRILPLLNDNDESSESDELPPFIAPTNLREKSYTRLATSSPSKAKTGTRDLKRTIPMSPSQPDIKSYFLVSRSTAAVSSKPRSTTAKKSTDAAVKHLNSTSVVEERSDGVSSIADPEIERNQVTSLVLSSPSKRKTREKSDQLTKSPRKDSTQRTARSRPVSPSPPMPRPMPTIEISSDSDSDDSLPTAIIPAKILPPLLRAKARVPSTSRPLHAGVKAISSDIIDLT